MAHLRLEHLAVVQPSDGFHGLHEAPEGHLPVLLVHLKEFFVHHDILDDCSHFDIVTVHVLFVAVLGEGIIQGRFVFGPLGSGLLVHDDLLLGEDDAAGSDWLHSMAQDDRAEEF